MRTQYVTESAFPIAFHLEIYTHYGQNRLEHKLQIPFTIRIIRPIRVRYKVS